jgi:hypothetical protein
MRTTLSYIAPLLMSGAAPAAIVAAPTATAAAADCNYNGGGLTDSQCQSPGNVQLNDSPPPVQMGGLSAYGPFFTYDRGRR